MNYLNTIEALHNKQLSYKEKSFLSNIQARMKLGFDLTVLEVKTLKMMAKIKEI